MHKYSDLLNELSNSGLHFESINDLNKINLKNKEIIPILLKYLKKYSDPWDKECIIRALSVKGFTSITNTLIEEFYRASDQSSLKWSIGNAISIIQDKHIKDKIIKIISEKEHGTARQMFCVALGKLKDFKSIPFLLENLNDPDLTGHAIIALSNFNEKRIIEKLEPFIEHPNSWIQKEAKSAIKKINKNIESRKN